MFLRKWLNMRAKAKLDKVEADRIEKCGARLYLYGSLLSSKDKEKKSNDGYYEFSSPTGDFEHAVFYPAAIDAVYSLLDGMDSVHLVKELEKTPENARKKYGAWQRDGFVKEYQQKIYDKNLSNGRLFVENNKLILLKRGPDKPLVETLFRYANFPWDYDTAFYGYLKFPFETNDTNFAILNIEVETKPYDIWMHFDNTHSYMEIDLNLQTVDIDEFISKIGAACEKNGKELILERYADVNGK